MRNFLLQAFPTRWQDVQDTFRKVTERPFGYILLDLYPKSSDDQRILSHILKEEGCIRCHQLKQDAVEWSELVPEAPSTLSMSPEMGDYGE